MAPNLEKLKTEALTNWAYEKHYYRPHELAIAILSLAIAVIAVVVTLSYLGKISGIDSYRITLIAVGAPLFIITALVTWYVCAKLSTLKEEYNWARFPETNSTAETQGNNA